MSLKKMMKNIINNIIIFIFQKKAYNKINLLIYN